MAVLNDADALMLGSQEIDAAYLGSTRVWSKWQIGDLFANGEQGALFFAADAGTRFQDAGGITPTTTAEQPVGTLLDTSQGRVLGPELIPLNAVWTAHNLGAVLTQTAHNAFRLEAPNAGIARLILSPGLNTNNFYVADYEMSSAVGAGLRFDAVAGADYLKNGRITIRGKANFTILQLYGHTGTDSVCTIHSFRHISGNHARQNTTTARPKYRIVGGKPAIIFDEIDDVLTMHAAVAPGTCTVVRSVPGVGAEITTGVSVGTSHNLTKSFHGLLIVNRALTPLETTRVTKWANDLAGVSP